MRRPLWLGLLAALLALSACVSEADPRDGNHEPPDGRADSDVRDGGAGDSARADAQDRSVTEDADEPRDSGDAGDESSNDAGGDGTNRDASNATDASDAGDARGPDASDATTDPVVGDVVTDFGPTDAGAGIDATDTGTSVDASDSSPPIDVNDASTPGDVSDAANDGDATVVDAGADGGDASDGAGDGGVVVFYQENFDTGFGTFSNPVTVCGALPPQWSNVAGYAHATDPATTGVSRISSPAVVVPANTSNITLRMSHKFDLEAAYDAAHLLISINGATAVQVTTFTSGGYSTGGQTNPTTCALSNVPSMYPGWSGSRAESVSEVNLSAAPFNVVAGNTVTITFRMTSDSIIDDVGWDINWVTLSGNSP